MKCYVVDGTGLDGLTLTERPDPGEPGPGEAVVDVHAVSLNYRDLMVADGRYGGRQSPPIVACSDMAGVVAAVGPGVTGLAAGDRVLNAPFRNWPAGTMRPEWVRTFVGGAGVDGVLAERLCYPAASLVKVPAHLDFAAGSTLTIAGLTAWAAVVTHGHARPGQWVLTHGTGGVSVWAAQIARTLGARVILTSHSEEKAALARDQLGVEHTLNYRDPDWPEQVRKLTGGGVHVVVEVAGGESLGRSIRACTYGGRVAVIGLLDGGESHVSVRDFLSHQVTVRGIFMESAEQLRQFAAAVEAAALTPHVDRVFAFAEARSAYDHLAAGRHVGKVVIAVR